MLLDKITKLGPYFLALPLVVFGIQHFMFAEFVVNLVPTWMPERLFWTYFAGVALFAAGIGIIFNILSHLAATLLGLMIFAWILVLHIPRALGDAFNGREFINVFDALMLSGGAFVLAGSLPGRKHLDSIANAGAKAGPFFIALALLVFGIEHFIYAKLVFIVGADYYNVPGATFWIYFSAVVFIAASIGILVSRRSSQTAALLGIFIFITTLFFYGPLLPADIFFGHVWATFLKGVAMSGTAFILSKSIARGETRIFETGFSVNHSKSNSMQ